ncbi:unnamed protein product [Tenebrio molitor]|nr:unnamed protein product [Tenebrio molitor]
MCSYDYGRSQRRSRNHGFDFHNFTILKLICLKIVRNKSSGDISSFPFVSGCLSTSLWLRYGFFINERSIILVNTIGASLFFAYVITFFIYSIKKSVVIRQGVSCCFLLVATLLYVENKENFEEAKKCLGIVCCVVTILFFAAPLASLLHVIKMKNSESLPFPIIFASFVVSMQWLIYGYILKDTFIQVPIIDSSCKKPLCLCNSTFMALVI